MGLVGLITTDALRVDAHALETTILPVLMDQGHICQIKIRIAAAHREGVYTPHVEERQVTVERHSAVIHAVLINVSVHKKSIILIRSNGSHSPPS